MGDIHQTYDSLMITRDTLSSANTQANYLKDEYLSRGAIGVGVGQQRPTGESSESGPTNPSGSSVKTREVGRGGCASFEWGEGEGG